MTKFFLSLSIVALNALLLGCSSSDGEAANPPVDDIDMTEADFGCVLEWDKVREFRITNKLGRLDEALEVAAAPSGKTYPVGTVIQLLPNEAMVKRREGFSPETKDWEFFFLDVSAAGTKIKARGTTEVENSFGLRCFDCHSKAEPQWDLLCEVNHGCDPIPLTAETIKKLQDGDDRCQ